MPGHLFIVRGDLLRLACDAVMVPSGEGRDGYGFISQQVWRDALGDLVDADGYLRDPPGPDRRVVKARPGGGINRPAMWASHTGDTGKSPEWYAAAVEQFIEAAAQEPVADGARPLGDARPLLGVPLVGTGDGGARDRRGEVLLVIMEATKDALDKPDTVADVVLVLNHDEGFSAAQQARRRVFGDQAWEELSSDHVAAAKRLSRHARQRDLVLFVGAGASIGAGLPSWGDLLEHLATAAMLHEAERTQLKKLDARDAGAVLEHRLGGKGALADAICALVATDRVALLHQLLASLPVTEAVTTNYDVCLETAFKDAGRPMRVLPKEGVGGARRWLVKLHGSVDNTERIVLSREDYLRFEGEGAALAGIVQALLLTRHMLFVGYSLSDDNFHRLVHQVRAVIGPRDDRPDTSLRNCALPTFERSLGRRMERRSRPCDHLRRHRGRSSPNRDPSRPGGGRYSIPGESPPR